MVRRHSSRDLLPGAAWTSTVDRRGWRQFRVVGRRFASGRLEIELMAICDSRVRFLLPAAELTDKAHFTRGWRPLASLQESKPTEAPGDDETLPD